MTRAKLDTELKRLRAKHFLSDIDSETLTGTCDNCGVVDIKYRPNRNQYICGPATREANVAYRKKKAEQEGREFKSQASPVHILSNIDTETNIGNCASCGLVDIYCWNGKCFCGTARKAASKTANANRPRVSITGVGVRDIHKLSNVDVETLTAECAKCGRTDVYHHKGRNTFSCKTVRRKQNELGRQKRVAYRKEQLELQNHQCAICSKELTVDTANVDHDHETDYIRLILCEQCNTGIGQLKEDPKILRAAADYLEQQTGRTDERKLYHNYTSKWVRNI